MWDTAWFCVSCKKELSNWQVMYSHGRCPKCGFKHPDACTIVETFERAYTLEPIRPWWAFWRGPYTKRVYLD